MWTFGNRKGKKPFENIVEKRENAGNQHFLLFPQCFLPYQRKKKKKKKKKMQLLSDKEIVVCKCFQF